MSAYQPIYSNDARIRRRVSQFGAAFTEVILDYQKAVDDDINAALRAIFGEFDKNGFRIILPLSGQFDTIDPQRKEVTPHSHSSIEKLADDAVIANLRWDFSENPERRKMHMEDLQLELETHYGNAISIPFDFTTQFLVDEKILWSDGTCIALSDGAGVLNWSTGNKVPFVVVDKSL